MYQLYNSGSVAPFFYCYGCYFVVKRRSNFPRSSFVHDYQEMILEMIWGLWSELPAHGRKAAQFVDLLGYFSLKHSEPRPADEGANDEGR